MDCGGFENVKEVIDTTLIGIGALAILIASVTYKLNLKQHYFTVINNCINKFQNNFITDDEFNNELKLKYLDLVNEQLFYIENSYIPSDISTEWIDGMIDFLPIRNSDKRDIQTNPSSKFGNSFQNLNIELYPRILRAFTLKESLSIPNQNLTQVENIEKRKEVVINIFTNIKRNQNCIRRHLAIKKAEKFMRETYKDYHLYIVNTEQNENN